MAKIQLRTQFLPLSTSLPLLLAYLLWFSSSSSFSVASRVEPLKNNGYDVLVGIHDSVKEDANIIDNLKLILTQVQGLLGVGARSAWCRC